MKEREGPRIVELGSTVETQQWISRDWYDNGNPILRYRPRFTFPVFRQSDDQWLRRWPKNDLLPSIFIGRKLLLRRSRIRRLIPGPLFVGVSVFKNIVSSGTDRGRGSCLRTSCILPTWNLFATVYLGKGSPRVSLSKWKFRWEVEAHGIGCFIGVTEAFQTVQNEQKWFRVSRSTDVASFPLIIN